MKKILLFQLYITFIISLSAQTKSWIRINQLGYLPTDVKVAVLVTKDSTLQVADFELCDALTEKPVFKSSKIQVFGEWAAFKKAFRLNFSAFTEGGSYFIKMKNVQSPVFRIGADVYDGTADFLLRYMRQQRCGFNPSLHDSCHTSGGYIVYGDSTREKYKQFSPYPIFGGWHDASDYLQYVATTATATFQMLFAYEQTPSVFKDNFQQNGLAGANGIPDILDEAKWGLDWLVCMNPEKNVLFNQVCDDRDHRGLRMPNKDTFTYDIVGSRARPVYRITGEPQGLGKYKNRTTGVASSAGKFASAFAAGARVLKPFYPNFADSLLQKAVDAYEYGKSDTGVCQTAPNRAPYFYEEDDWVDDMQLANFQLNLSFKPISIDSISKDSNGLPDFENEKYSKVDFPQNEIKNWIGKDTSRHYQWYPFLNYAHVFQRELDDLEVHISKPKNLKISVEKIINRGKNNPFQIGTPFIWCSNNYISAAITQMNLYRNSTGDTSYIEAEAAHRDWLFGCNPWGTSMIYGLPSEGVSPRDPHSAFTYQAKMPIDGGLVDGPIYGSIYGKLIGITLYQPDEFAEFQSPLVVYHDDFGDYSSNEPTMDGTASLLYFLASKQNEDRSFTENVGLPRGIKLPKGAKDYIKAEIPFPLKPLVYEKEGALNRLSTSYKEINLVFTGHEFTEGGESILKTLKKHKIKASFFFTGDFIRNNKDLVKRLKAEGHYIGAHSDKHLLYCDWTKRDSTLISKQTFFQDLKNNFIELEKLGIEKKDASVFMPPFNGTTIQLPSGQNRQV
jgi:endoglucanase